MPNVTSIEMVSLPKTVIALTDMPCCPLCDQPIEMHDPVYIGETRDADYHVIALVHTFCTDEAREK